MSKPEMTPKQIALTKARMAARVGMALFILGGAILLLIGILTQFLPQVLNGTVMLGCSVPLWYLSKLIEGKLAATLS